jgi:uncharacterized protein YbjT (DUF2867 family)
MVLPMTKAIAVVGGTGNVGGRVAAKLAAKGEPVRSVSRHGQGPGGVQADLTRIADARRAVQGCDAVYLTPPMDTPDPHANQRVVVANVLEAAREAGVRHVVAHTILGAGRGGSGCALVDEKHAVERMVEEAGVPFTLLRPGWMLQMLHGLRQPLDQGVLPLPLPADAPFGVVSAEDVAAAACAFLEVGPSDRGFDVCVTTSGAGIARALAAARGAPVQYVPMAGRARAWIEPAPISPAFKDLVAGMFDHAAGGSMAAHGEGLARVLPGFRYTSPEEFARAELFPRP